MYIFEGKDNYASIINSENSLTQQEKEKGIHISNLPTKEIIQGKAAILKADKAKELVWWEYVDIIEDVSDTAPIMLTKAQFLRRLTEDELNKVTNYEMFTTGTDKLQKDMAMKTLWMFFNTFENVNLADASWVSDFAQVIIWTGLITEARLKEILGL